MDEQGKEEFLPIDPVIPVWDLIKVRQFALSLATAHPSHEVHSNPYTKANEYLEYVLYGTIPVRVPPTERHDIPSWTSRTEPRWEE